MFREMKKEDFKGTLLEKFINEKLCEETKLENWINAWTCKIVEYFQILIILSIHKPFSSGYESPLQR